MTALRVVQTEESWGIYGQGIDVPQLFGGPEDALAHFAMNPAGWPEAVDFWLALCARGGEHWDALGRKYDDLKRPVFHSPLMARRMSRDPIWPLDYVAIDFWFLLRLIESLEETDYRFVVIRDGEEPFDAHIRSGSVEFLLHRLRVRRKSDWRKNFLLVQEPVLNWFGVAGINERAARSGWQYRISHKEIPPTRRHTGPFGD